MYVGMKNKAARDAMGIHSGPDHAARRTRPRPSCSGCRGGAQRRPRDPRHPGPAAAPGPHRRGEVSSRPSTRCKDVDGFHPDRALGGWRPDSGVISSRPCTPAGVVEMLVRSPGTIRPGSHVVIVGGPVEHRRASRLRHSLLMRKAPGGNATVTVASLAGRRTWARVTRSADILVVAIGTPGDDHRPTWSRTVGRW